MTAGLENDVRTYMMVRSCSCRYVTHVRQDGFGGWTPGDVLQHDGGRMEEDTLQEVCRTVQPHVLMGWCICRRLHNVPHSHIQTHSGAGGRTCGLPITS